MTGGSARGERQNVPAAAETSARDESMRVAGRSSARWRSPLSGSDVESGPRPATGLVAGRTVAPEVPARERNFGFGEESTLNVPRLAARNRRHWKEGAALILRVAEDGRIDPAEEAALLEWQAGGQALGSVIDVNDQFGRATSCEQVGALNRERNAWLERLPELKQA
jgi:hypothetical protein